VRGFTLVETLVALVLLTLALLLGLGLVLQQPRIVRRLDAQREALHSIEATLEALRAGALPPVSQDLPPVGPRRMALSIRITPEGYPPGLYRVRVSARYLIEGQSRERSVESLLWRPPEP
jgi:prepilin-type N-terminal cleavage/methylation domain-containing protein